MPGMPETFNAIKEAIAEAKGSGTTPVVNFTGGTKLMSIGAYAAALHQDHKAISLYVDTILASGSTGPLAPIFGAGCEITNEFIIGQTIVFRVYGNDWSLKGAPLSPLNVSSATVTVAGVTAPLALAYGNHSGEAFYTAALKTGTAAGLYSTLGIITYTVTVNTIAVPAVTKKVRETKLVPTLKNGKRIVRHGKVVTHRVTFLKTIVVTPAVAGATGTFVSNFSPSSVATLNALPAA